ncbi:cytochrome P450 [Kibdelosporangium banguiense]|uniref:Cytochrome P450 n=1 Tax=Kibdelosporangium banguiense TaxID=1365924 RepID=A0ABS4TPZ5_9PSEU|nr:cytochrome P450 [Kibdelosporangium banguiense]MBP2326476.1 cytochrome P450 [Kibdelosporangium banguiense]
MQAEPEEPLERIPADFMRDPYELLRKYRDKGPVHEVIFAHGAKAWLVTRYDEIRALVNDPRVSKDGRRMNELFARHSGVPFEEDETASVGFDDELSANLINTDPPRHTRLRSLVSKAFTRQRMEKLRPRVEEVVDGLLDAFTGRSEVDLMSEFAVRLPITILSDLFGMPEDELNDFRLWSLKLVGAGHDPAEVTDASNKVNDYADELIDSKRANPGDDLVSALVQVTDGDDRLTRAELRAMIFVLVVAGHITTIYSIGNATANLLTHPGELAKLRADLSLMPVAVDELLRYDGSAAVATFMFTKAEIPVGDTVIPADQILALSWHSANRDDRRFPDGDRLDLNRRPVGSMAFGHGIHYCIGTPLAKLQIEIALTKLITRYPNLRLAVEPDQLPWISSSLLRGLEALPVLVS